MDKKLFNVVCDYLGRETINLTFFKINVLLYYETKHTEATPDIYIYYFVSDRYMSSKNKDDVEEYLKKKAFKINSLSVETI